MIINLDFTILLKALCQNGKSVICNSKKEKLFPRELVVGVKVMLTSRLLIFLNYCCIHIRTSVVYAFVFL